MNHIEMKNKRINKYYTENWFNRTNLHQSLKSSSNPPLKFLSDSSNIISHLYILAIREIADSIIFVTSKTI